MLNFLLSNQLRNLKLDCEVDFLLILRGVSENGVGLLISIISFVVEISLLLTSFFYKSFLLIKKKKNYSDVKILLHLLLYFFLLHFFLVLIKKLFIPFEFVVILTRSDSYLFLILMGNIYFNIWYEYLNFKKT